MAPDTFTHKSDHLANPALLRKIDELRERNIGKHVPLPQVSLTTQVCQRSLAWDLRIYSLLLLVTKAPVNHLCWKV
jgi:hypothetical protein